jgi:ATP-dependent Clp protease ATP-binding subunit ClpB
MGLRVTEEAVEVLCEAGYDPAFGARPVKRAVQHLLETALAQAGAYTRPLVTSSSAVSDTQDIP